MNQRKSAFGRLAAIGLTAWLAVSPARAAEIYAVTPSAATEAHFPAVSAEVSKMIQERCADAKWTIISSTDTQVICESPMAMMESAITQAFLGNSYSTPPRRYLRFSLVETPTFTRVLASGWIELQMAFGQINRRDLADPDFHNVMMDLMTSVGGAYPLGTRFPNHALLGVLTQPESDGRKTALKVVDVSSGGPAEQAGFQVGDVLKRVAGKKITDQDSLRGALEKAVDKPTYEVELMRGEEEVRVTVNRAFRPDVTAPVVMERRSTSDGSDTPQASIADELEKLAKLKERGILTEEEFKAQKAKLLAK